MLGLGGNASVGIGLSITLNDRFSRNATAITNQMLRMGQTAAQVKANMRGALTSLQMAGGAMAGIGYGAYKGISKAVESYKDFEYTMRSIRAVAGDSKMSASNLDALSKSARNLGIEYGILPTKVSEAMFVLAKAGITSEKEMASMTRSVLQLSAAADEPADKMAHDLISVLNTFQKKASSATDVADMLSKSANMVQLDVQDLFESIKYSGNTAQSLSIPLEEMLANLAFIGSKGLKGSMGGIALQNSLVELSRAVIAPKKNQVRAMETFGLTPKIIHESTNGLKNLVGLGEILAKNTKGMNEEMLNTNLEFLAGRRGARFLAPLIKDYEKLQELRQGVKGAKGSAESTAKARLDSLAGAQAKLKAAMEDFKIGVGAPFAEFLKAVTPGLTKVLKIMTALVSTKAGKFFLLMAGGALLLVGAVGAILLPLATMGLLLTNARGGFMGMQQAATWAFNAISNSITSATQRLRIFTGMQQAAATPTGWAQYPAGTMINGRAVGGQIYNANNMAASTGMMEGMMAGGTAKGLTNLINGASILYGAFTVLSDFMTGRFKAGLTGLLGGVIGFMMGGPLGVMIGAGLGSMIGGLFEDGEASDPSGISSQKNRDFYRRGISPQLEVQDQTNQFQGYGRSTSGSSDYYNQYIKRPNNGGQVNVYVDGKKATETYLNGKNEDIYVGGDIQ